MHRIILHIDFDSFFASVEQQLHPEFRGKPLGVTARNGRTAIIAVSREAKRRGLSNVMRTYDALRICPELQLTCANFTAYLDVSKKFIRLCNYFSPEIEVFSIDELFMDVTLTSHLFGGVDNLVKIIKQRIKEELGEYITVSVGISHNKMLSKLASGLKKPNGVCKIDPADVEAVYRRAKLTDICGIGARIERRLNMMGIYTLLQLRKTPLEKLIAEFGNVEGHFLYNVGQGRDVSPLVSYSHAPSVKSVGRNYCLPKNTYDKRIVLQNIYELCEEVCIKLRRLQKKARLFGLSLRGSEEIYGHILHDYYSYQARDMFASCLNIFARKSSERGGSMWNGYVRQISVFASYLQDSVSLPRSLFVCENKWENVTKVVDRINEKFGDHTIRNGFLLYADKLTTMPNGFLADRYERRQLTMITP